MTNAMSGPVSTIGISLARGVEAYFNWVNEQGGVHGLALAGDAAEGVYAGAWIVDPVNAPEAGQYRQVLKKYFPGEVPGGYSLSSWVGGEVAVEALKRAGPDLTREKFIEAMESIRNFITGLTPPFSYSADDHQGIKQIAIVQGQNGKWVPVKEFFGE